VDLGLSGRRAIVTGGSKGIGLSIARTFAEEGADVAICARDPEPLAHAVEELRSRGVNAIGDALDVGDHQALERWIDAAAGRLGGLDCFVANVSALAVGPGLDVWEAEHRIDLMHTVHGCVAALPHLERSDAAAIVIVSSTSANSADSGSQVHAYGATKAALVSYGAQLAQTAAASGVRVNVVSPGAIDFPGGFWDRVHEAAPASYEAAARGAALGRHGRPEEIGRAVVFLASPASSFTTGANLRVDGGFLKTVNF
jgi:3-oxoacyl-[acyl-carrier protein] reductase